MNKITLDYEKFCLESVKEQTCEHVVKEQLNTIFQEYYPEEIVNEIFITKYFISQIKLKVKHQNISEISQLHKDIFLDELLNNEFPDEILFPEFISKLSKKNLISNNVGKDEKYYENALMDLVSNGFTENKDTIDPTLAWLFSGIPLARKTVREIMKDNLLQLDASNKHSANFIPKTTDEISDRVKELCNKIQWESSGEFAQPTFERE